MKLWKPTLAFLAALAASCGDGPQGAPASRPETLPSPEPLAAAAPGESSPAGAPTPGAGVLSRETRLDPAQAGTLRGTVFLEGRAPAPRPLKIDAFPACLAHHEKPPIFENLLVENGRVRNVVVYLRRGLPEGMIFPPPAGKPRLDQEGCVFAPHVQVVRVGQTVTVDSADEVAHNIRTLSRRNPALNFNMPPHEQGRTIRFERAEMPPVKVKCDVHPWMGAWIAVLDHPFAAVTAADGTFELRGVPPGEYIVRAWHEELGILDEKVVLEPRKEATLDFTLKAPSSD